MNKEEEHHQSTMYFCLKFVEKMLSKAVTSDTENQCNSVQGGAHTT